MVNTDDFAAWLRDPELDETRMRQICADPRFHAELARHPAAPTSLLRWLANSPDPEVRAALAERGVVDSSGPGAGPKPTRRLGLGVLVGVLIVAVVGGGAALTVGPRVASWLSSGGQEPSGQGGTGQAAADPERDFRNGVEEAWTLELADALPELTNPVVSASEPYGYLSGGFLGTRLPAADGVLALAVRGEDGQDYQWRQLGVAVDTGETLWSSEELFTCVAAEEFFCQDDAGAIHRVEPRTGESQKIAQVDGIGERQMVLVADPAGLAVILQDEEATDITGLGPDGEERWHLSLGGYVAGDVAFSSYSSRFGVLNIAVGPAGNEFEGQHWIDLATGEVLAAGSGTAVLTQDRQLVTDAGFEHWPVPRVPVQEHAAGLALSVEPRSWPFDSDGRNEDAVLVLTNEDGIQVCPGSKYDACRQVEGPFAGLDLYQDSLGLSYNAGRPYLTVAVDARTVEVVDVESATHLGTFTEGIGWQGPEAEPRLTQLNVALTDGGKLQFNHPITQEVLAAVPSQDWVGLPSEDGYQLMAEVASSDSYSVDVNRFTMFVGAREPVGFHIPGQQGDAPERPAELPQCPESMIELAFATYTHGWILVCGYYVDAPAEITFSYRGEVSRSTETGYDGLGTYRASFGDWGVWLSSVPGTVGKTTTTGEIDFQGATNIIWYLALGGTQQATGAYEVPLPDDTAEDQVRYLSEIIERSRAARSSLITSVTALRECAHGTDGSYREEISAIDGVTANREQLLAAVAAAPVDKVPDGAQLVSELTVALRHSRDADVAFANWARTIDRLGCGQGSSADGDAASKRASAAKQVFSEHWNATIVPQFGVAAVSPGEL